MNKLTHNDSLLDDNQTWIPPRGAVDRDAVNSGLTWYIALPLLAFIALLLALRYLVLGIQWLKSLLTIRSARMTRPARWIFSR
jgi:hypothetical protein